MNTAISVAQGILAAVFLAASAMKVALRHDALVEKTPYAEDFTGQ